MFADFALFLVDSAAEKAGKRMAVHFSEDDEKAGKRMTKRQRQRDTPRPARRTAGCRAHVAPFAHARAQAVFASAFLLGTAA